MTIISPSLLSCDFTNIEEELNHFKDFDNIWLHLDVMDGHFVPNLTFGMPITKMISKKTTQPLDAHLMVSNPEFHLDEFAKVPLQNFTFHLEATKEPLSLLKKAKEHFPSVGISIKPKTLVSKISPEVLKEVNLILVMSVEPGFGGQSFIEGTYEKIEALDKLRKEQGLNFKIQVDGGVNSENAKKLIASGCDVLVAGSYVFKDGPASYLNKIESLRS